MIGLLTSLYAYYPLELLLQGFCVWHCIKRGTQSKWIWIIVFLPLIGSLAYLFTEVIQKRHTNALGGAIGSVVNPSGRIKKMEQNLKFSDTYANRIALADAYLDAKMYNKAIELYEPVTTGIFDNSEDTIKKLIEAYFKAGRLEDVIKIAPKVKNSLNFTKSPANFYYARAFEETSRLTEAETEYKKMRHNWTNYQQRYYYAMFLVNANRPAEAVPVFEEILTEAQHLTGHEKRDAAEWVSRSKQEYKKLEASGQSV